MQPSELRGELRRRQLEWRRVLLPRLRERMRDHFARLERTGPFRAAREALVLRRRRRRQRTMAAVALALLALLFLDCSGAPGKPQALAKATPIAKVKPTPPPKPKPKPAGALQARLDPQKRPGYTLDARPGSDWLDEFRLQVAARSPRLAECFNGSERGGTLRWTVSVDAKSGSVSDHDFEPLGAKTDFGSKQAACTAGVLSDPPYRFENPPESDALANRVSLVLEF